MGDIVESAGSWIYRMLITLVCATIVIAIVGVSMPKDINTIYVQKELMHSRIIYSPESIWYKDLVTQTTHIGIVDAERFDQDLINKLFIYPQTYGGAEIMLKDSSNKSLEEPVYINGEVYRKISTEVSANLRNKGSVNTYVYPIIIKTGASYQNGYLVVNVAMPRRT